MADNLKKFFKKKKLEFKFKKAGPGHRLDENTAKPADSRRDEPECSRVEPSYEAKQAAAAALARLQIGAPSGFTSSSLYKQAKNEIRRELENVTPGANDAKCEDNETEETMSRYAASGVYFRCPLLGPEILSKTEWKAKIKEYLYEQLETEKGLTACLIMRNCNSNVDKINACTETLCKYLQNILSHPDEEKYKKIRISNKVFQEKVVCIEGSAEFLEAAGFAKQQLPVQNGEEEFYVFSETNVKDFEYLQVLIDALENAETINLELDRNIQVLQPSQAARRTRLPDDFFRYTPEELKKEQQARTESVENSLVLRTKAMREKHEQKLMKKYRYALIRIRFPDGIFLQGTFSVYEKYEDIIEFVKENLTIDCDFSLLTELGKSFYSEDYEKSLFELRLVPATVLIFRPSGMLSNELSLPYLKPDIIALLQNL